MTKQEFVNKFEGHPAIIDFWAEWCGPCKSLEPILEEVSKESGIPISKINIETNMEIAQEFEVSSIPTVVIIKNGKIVDTLVGVRQKNHYLDIIKNQ